MSKDPQNFAELPPQGYAFMTDLQRFDHRVRCAVLDVLPSGTAGLWNIEEVFRQIAGDLRRLSDHDLGALSIRNQRKQQ